MAYASDIAPQRPTPSHARQPIDRAPATIASVLKFPQAVKHKPAPKAKASSICRRLLRNASFVTIAFILCPLHARAGFASSSDIAHILTLETVISRLCRHASSEHDRRAVLAGLRVTEDGADRPAHLLARHAPGAASPAAVASASATSSVPAPVVRRASTTSTSPSPLRRKAAPIAVVPIERVRPSVGDAPAPSAKSRPRKPIPYFAGDRTPSRFITDDGVEVVLSAPPDIVAFNRRNGRNRPKATTPTAAEGDVGVDIGDDAAPVASIAKGRVSLADGVGAVFDLDVWAVDLSDAPALPCAGQCKNPDVVCDAPALKAGAYCEKCAGVFFAPPNERTYVGQLVKSAMQQRKAKSAKAERLKLMRAAHARFTARQDTAPPGDTLLLAAE